MTSVPRSVDPRRVVAARLSGVAAVTDMVMALSFAYFVGVATGLGLALLWAMACDLIDISREFREEDDR